jgi:tRNA threonylcarbamoyl adenosine modification protein (Sua5/YciO/YrdC/YwlC family)
MQITTVQLDDARQADETAAVARDILEAGGLVVFPTETVYGVGAAAASSKGYEALRQVKGGVDQPFAVHLPDPAVAERYVDLTSPLLRRLLWKVFPGPVTLQVEVSDEVIHRKIRDLNLPAEVRSRLYHRNTIALRCPDHPLAQRILAAAPWPILASSAVGRGQRPPHEAEDAARAIGDQVDLIIDGGRTRYSKPSTIVSVRGSGSDAQATVERPGVYDERFIRKLLRWTVLLVCSGNTCRSPMAEGLARQLLAEQRGIPVEQLEEQGVRILSAGAFAASGSPAAPEAVEALSKFNIDISGHRSRPLTPELIHEADVIYCMARSHRQFILELFPSATDKTLLLDPGGDVEDPIGANITTYQRCAELIRRQLAQRLKEQEV